MARETIGQRVRRLRVAKGLSQRDLQAPGVTYAYVSRIEAGTRKPSVKALRKLARKLGVTVHYLETGRRDAVVTLPLSVARAASEALRGGDLELDLAAVLLDRAVRQAERSPRA